MPWSRPPSCASQPLDYPYGVSGLPTNCDLPPRDRHPGRGRAAWRTAWMPSPTCCWPRASSRSHRETSSGPAASLQDPDRRRVAARSRDRADAAQRGGHHPAGRAAPRRRDRPGLLAGDRAPSGHGSSRGSTAGWASGCRPRTGSPSGSAGTVNAAGGALTVPTSLCSRSTWC